MAYTRTPTMDTRSTEDIDLTREITLRAGNIPLKDEDYENIFIERTRSKLAKDDRIFVTKRAGTTVAFTGGSGTLRGSFYWEDQKKLYYCTGSDVYIYDVVAGTSVTLSGFFASTGGPVGFSEYLYQNGTAVMVISDGVRLAKVDTANVITVCTDPDLPTPHDPNIVFLDGYIFLCKLGTGDIFNSVLDDPMSWDPTNFINAELEADTLIRLAKVNNYLVAFGKETIEYFWDAGVATGSPLQRNDTPVKRIAYLTGFAQEQNNVYFIGKDSNGVVQVYKMYEFKVEPISSVSISRYLGTLGTNYVAWTGAVFSHNGHKFYMVNAADTRTYVCDLTEDNLWTRMSFQQQAAFNIARAHIIRTDTNAYQCFFRLTGEVTGLWYKFDDTIYRDNGINFDCTLITEAADFGTMYRKTMHRLTLVGDRPPINGNMSIYWSDDDYQTFQGPLITNLNQDLPCVYQLGSFRQRIFKLIFSENTLMRIQKMSADINKGGS